MSAVNKVILLGNLGGTPELKQTHGGIAVANFSMATTETWVDKTNERQERTEWHKVVMWGKLAELAVQYLKKGDKVYIEGKLKTSAWEDGDGAKRYTTEIVAAEFESFAPRPEKRDKQGPSVGRVMESFGAQQVVPPTEVVQEKISTEPPKTDALPF